MIGLVSGGQQCSQNGSLTGTIKSAFRFDGASDIATKTTIVFDLIARPCLIFSLIYVLIDHIIAAAIVIVQGDRDGHRRRRSRDSVRRAA